MNANPVEAPAPVAPLEPRLPQELERIIFEIAAHSDRERTLPRLLQVARRVRDWLQPLIYDIIILKDSEFYTESKSPLHHPPRFPSGPQTAHVRHLMVSNHQSPTEAEPHWRDLLPQCHNLQELLLWTELVPPDTNTLALVAPAVIHSPLRTVSPHGLLRLSASLVDFFPGGRADFGHEVFRDLTHLEVLDFPHESGGRWVEGNNYGCLPRLRCLSIAYFDLDADADPAPPDNCMMLQKCLEECGSLEVLVVLEESEYATELAEELLETTRRMAQPDGTVREVAEDRVVDYHGYFISEERWATAWFRATTTGDDFWVHSEKIIQRRRRKRELETMLWDSMVDSGADVDLGEWMAALERSCSSVDRIRLGGSNCQLSWCAFSACLSHQLQTHATVQLTAQPTS